MKLRVLAFAAALAMQGAAAESPIWVATCTAKDLQYNQTIGGKGIVHIGAGNGSYQSIKLSQTFYDGSAVCGTTDTGQPAPLLPMTEICASRSRDSIYLLTKNIKDPSGAMRELPYCQAQITVVQ